jgi:hypothetical protein
MSSTGPVRVTINIEISPCTETYEIDRAAWDAMTPTQRREYLDDMVQVELANAGGAGWDLDDPDDEAATAA